MNPIPYPRKKAARRKKKATEAKSEDQVQAKLIAEIRRRLPGVPTIVNPHSSQRKNMTPAAAARIAQYNYTQGFEEGQADVILPHCRKYPNTPAFEFVGLCVELKTEKEDPFRKSKAGYWIDTSVKRDLPGVPTKGAAHAQRQAFFLHKMRENGHFATFAAGEAQALAVLDWYLDRKLLEFEKYEFDYNLEKCWIWKIKS